MNQYFPKEFSRSARFVKVQADLSNYEVKVKLKEAIDIGTSTLVSKTNLAGLKTKVDTFDMDNLNSVSAGLSKLRNVVDSDVVKKVCMINLLPKSVLLVLRHQVLVD